ncbi:MAG: hypothetical protein IJE97_15905 [Thermoguttaceae bacterium]|nr:hypothetical protein [Thermoguttaceae bacterium]
MKKATSKLPEQKRDGKTKRGASTLRVGAVVATILTVVAIAAVSVGGVRSASAAETSTAASRTRPIAILSSGGYDALWGATERMAKELKFAEIVETARKIYGDVRGLDREKPFGIVVATDGSTIATFAFLPIENVEKLDFKGSDALKEKVETTPEGLFLNAGTRWRLLEKDGWLFVVEAGKEEAIANVDPTAWLGENGGKGALTVEIDFTVLPQEFLEAGFASLRQKAAEIAPVEPTNGGGKNGDKSENAEKNDATAAAREQLNATLKYYSAILDSLERVAWTLDVDAATGALVWNCSIVCKEGSALAETLNGAENAETRWGAIAATPNAVYRAAQAGKYSAADREFQAQASALYLDNFKSGFETALDDAEELAFAEEVFALVEKIAKSTFEDGTVDAASAFACEPVVFSSACAPVAGEALTNLVRKLVEKLKADRPEDAEKIARFAQVNAETVEGFAVSKLDVPFAEFEKEGATLPTYWSDKTLAVRLGTTDTAALLVVGLESTEADAEFARIAAAATTKTPVRRRVDFAVAPLGRWALEAFGESEALTGGARRMLKRVAEAEGAGVEVEYKIDGVRLDARYVASVETFRLIGDLIRINIVANLSSGNEGEDVDELFEEE